MTICEPCRQPPYLSRWQMDLSARSLFYERLQSVDRHTHVWEFLLIFRYDIALEAAVVKVERNVFKSVICRRELLQGELKKVHIVGLLVYLAFVHKNTSLYFKKSSECEPMTCICIFRIRTAKVKIDTLHWLIGDSALQILRLAPCKSQVRYALV